MTIGCGHLPPNRMVLGILYLSQLQGKLGGGGPIWIQQQCRITSHLTAASSLICQVTSTLPVSEDTLELSWPSVPPTQARDHLPHRHLPPHRHHRQPKRASRQTKVQKVVKPKLLSVLFVVLL